MLSLFLFAECDWKWFYQVNLWFEPIELLIHESNGAVHSRTRLITSIYFTFIDTNSCVLPIFDQCIVFDVLFECESSLESKFQRNPLHFYSNESIYTLISMLETCHLLHGFMRGKSTIRVKCLCCYLDVEMACHTKTMAEKYYGPCAIIRSYQPEINSNCEEKEELLGFHCGNCHSI